MSGPANDRKASQPSVRSHCVNTGHRARLRMRVTPVPTRGLASACAQTGELQDVAAQVFVLAHMLQAHAHHRGIHHDALAA